MGVVAPRRLARSRRDQCSAWRSSASASWRNTLRRWSSAILGKAAEQRAAGELVGVHVLDVLEPLGVEARRSSRRHRTQLVARRPRGTARSAAPADRRRSGPEPAGWPGCHPAGSCRSPRRRAYRRSTAPSASRTPWPGSRRRARRRPRRATPTRARGAPWWSRPVRLRQKLEKSCSPRNGSDANRILARSSASGTHHAYRARNGSGSVTTNDRVPIGAPLCRATGVERRHRRARRCGRRPRARGDR